MSRYDDTIRAIAEITDPGRFENLATAVLRSARPELYGNLTQPGVNAEGKTIKSPVDGIAFVRDAIPRHMVTVHHTICLQKDLREKWLNSPHKGSNPSAPPGDIVKTAAIAVDERRKSSALRVTLALTTNKEPRENVTREAERVAHTYGITLDVWTRSRLAHYLDHTADGQGIRRRYLGVEQERLSKGLLRELSLKSLEAHRPSLGDAEWVARPDAVSIIEGLAKPVGFLVGESGFGKSVTCHQYLARHLERGGIALVLPHEVLASSLTLDQALDLTLRQLHPMLAVGSGAEVRSLCSSESPLHIVVEDVSRSGQSARLIERLAQWSASARRPNGVPNMEWRLICPIWPGLFSELADETRKYVEPLAAQLGPFTADDARRSILLRAALEELQMSALEADAISQRLGYDPLLIGLSDLRNNTVAEEVVAAFIHGSAGRLATGLGMRTASDYIVALRKLAHSMLANLTIDPSWTDVTSWFGSCLDQMTALRELTRQGEIIRLMGCGDPSRLGFRHDRVRNWLLTDAATHALQENNLDDAVFSEPFFADVIGACLADSSTPPAAAERARLCNPLALFYALRLFREASAPVHQAVLAAISDWLTNDASRSRVHQSLRHAALRVLSDTQSAHVVPLLSRFGEHSWIGLLAGLRNGDLGSGLALCYLLEPGIPAPWRDRAIEHARALVGTAFVTGLSEFLKRKHLENNEIIGALRLAGHLGETSLAEPIKICWESDAERDDRLESYLWAAAQCGGECTEEILSPVCDAWAALPDQPEEKGAASLRDNLAAHEVAWAFWRQLPGPALTYFMKRAERNDLRWQITYMLHGLDNPDGVVFIAREMADQARRFEGTHSFSLFSHTVRDHWRRQQDDGRPMSQESRNQLETLWSSDGTEKHLRQQSFRLWAATKHPDDLTLLQSSNMEGVLADDTLRARLERLDKTAVPQLIKKIHGADTCYWWHFARHVWSEGLTAALSEQLAIHGRRATPAWGEGEESDWILAEMVIRLPPTVAERLLCKHWHHLLFSPFFIQAALYAATPRLASMVADAVQDCPSPSMLFEHIDHHFGIMTSGHPGVTRIEQIEGLLPYLDYLSEFAMYQFWELCNQRGWLKIRRTHFDVRLSSKWKAAASVDDADLVAELDKELTHNGAPWPEHWIKRHVHNGRSVEELLNIVRQWLRSNKTSEALEIAAAAVVYAGSRADIEILNEGSGQSRMASGIIEDTRFAVFQRTLS